MPAIYVRYFSAEEMRELIAFYRTPIGSKLLTATPRIEEDFFAANASDLLDLQNQLQQTFNTILRKHGYLH